MWSRRRGGDGDARPLDTPAGPAATPATPAADGGWAALPVIQRTVTPITPMVGVASFRDGLAAQTPPHPFIGSLGHEVSRQAPAGIVTGLAAPVQRSDGPNMPVRSPDAPVEAEPRWRSLWSRPRRTLPFGSRNVESVQRSSSPGSAGRAGSGDAPARMPVVSRSSTTAAGPTMTTARATPPPTTTTAGATPPPTTTTTGATPAPRMSTAGRPPISKPAMTVAQRTITASPPSATPAGGPGAGGGPLGGTPEGRRPAGAPAAAPESRAAAEATPPAPSPLVAGPAPSAPATGAEVPTVLRSTRRPGPPPAPGPTPAPPRTGPRAPSKAPPGPAVQRTQARPSSAPVVPVVEPPPAAPAVRNEADAPLVGTTPPPKALDP